MNENTSFSSLFVGHDFQHQTVSLVHTARTNLREIADTLIYILINDAFHRGYTTIFHRHNSRQHSCRYTCGHLQCAQLGLAPSQIIPVRLAIIFCTAYATCSYPPPINQVMPQLEPVAATTQPHKADNLPKLCLI